MNEHLRKVFPRLRKHGVKLQPGKCEIFRNEVKYLGQIITPNGCKIDPDNKSAVKKILDKLQRPLAIFRRYWVFSDIFVVSLGISSVL